MHAEVARRLRERPELLHDARARVETWVRDGPVHPHYARLWRDLLNQPLNDVCRDLVGTSDQLRAMRQSSPFAGMIDSQTRWRIMRETREQWEAR